MNFSMDDHVAASAVVSLNGGAKRDRDIDSPDAAGGFKRGRVAAPVPQAMVPEVAAPAVAPASVSLLPELKPYPFFRYTDYAATVDSDSLSPLTLPGRVPNFPAKMHSILSRPELADIICWLPHGRAWRILKPREFEIKVIPTYFEHTKFSSFIRQANGWGFRRMTQGRDRNSYYQERFLRGLPHLCKEMKRPGVSKKPAVDADHEPDLYKISELQFVPEKSKDDSILLQCTIQGGPKARMPIYSGALSSAYKSDTQVGVTNMPALPTLPMVSVTSKLTPTDHKRLASFQQGLGTFESQLKNLQLSVPLAVASPHAPVSVALPPSIFAAAGQSPFPTMPATGNNKMSALAAANQLAFANTAAAFQATTAASQFAAGFAAAAALSQQQFRSMMETFAANNGMPVPNGQPAPPSST